MKSAIKTNSIPLVVDLDGTLINTDMLMECVSQFIATRPMQIFKLLLWLVLGKAVLKKELAKIVFIDAETLPYNKEVLSWVQCERKKGRYIVLATGSHRIIAEQIALHLELFDEVLATDDKNNFISNVKAQVLVEKFGNGCFDYVGNDWADLDIWTKARLSHIVNPTVSMLSCVQRVASLGSVFNANKTSKVKAFLKAMRLHQWMKNLLVFVPLFTAHLYGDVWYDTLALMAFVIFSLTASSVYLLNDLVDLPDDRHHLYKRQRPFASGEVNLILGWFTWPILLITAAMLSLVMMPLWFSISLGIYYFLTLLYSFKLKKYAIIDVMILACLYTLRIIAGTLALGLDLSFWLLLFSMFIFLSLALIKRYSELKNARDLGNKIELRGRGYNSGDLEIVSSLGGSAGMISVLILALYIEEGRAAAIYAMPKLIWIVCPIMLYWISRVWLLAHRGSMHDDPIIFAIKDKVSWSVALITILIFSVARFI